MKWFKRSILWAVTLPWDLVCWFLVVNIYTFWGNKLWWNYGLWTELTPNSWPTRTWYRYKIKGKPVLNRGIKQERRGKWMTWAGTCLGHGGFYGPGVSGGRRLDTPTEFHEHVHVEQYEVSMLSSFVLGLIVFGVVYHLSPLVAVALGSGIWLTGKFHFWIPAGIVGYLRGEGAYSGSISEEHANAIVAVRNFLEKK